MATNKDVLTGLANRPALDGALQAAIEHADGVSLAVLDIDHFHDVNTELGPETGDHLLQALGKMLQEVTPDGAYRLSGDEFALVLPGKSLEEAFLSMEALRSRVEGAAGTLGLPRGRGVTITIGVAQHPRDAKDVRGLLSAADAALGAAKENGRNQIGLPPNEEMVMKSCYYPATSVRKLKALAERLGRKESRLLREALDDLFRKYDTPRRT